MRRIALFSCLTISALAQSGVVVIRGARVVDGTGSPARAATVVIQGSRIESVGPDVAAPAGARVIDANGQTLLPGLFDLHTHLTASAATGVSGDWGKNLKAYLACGITTVNDYSTSAEMIAPMFRKIRLTMVDGKPYACHMAIADRWDIWYLNAYMAFSEEKRAEEAIFMQDFDRAFAARHKNALDEMSRRVGLDYFIVDCAENQNGELLVFEADNTAVVHNMDSPVVFPYKPPQMRKIFAAFTAMLLRHAKAGCKADVGSAA